MSDEKPYWVELETGCVACGRGREYRVIGPDDVALGATFDEEADAEEYAENLTVAYEAGRASVKDEQRRAVADASAGMILRCQDCGYRPCQCEA